MNVASMTGRMTSLSQRSSGRASLLGDITKLRRFDIAHCFLMPFLKIFCSNKLYLLTKEMNPFYFCFLTMQHLMVVLVLVYWHI